MHEINEIEWFLRDEIKQKIDSNARAIAQLALKLKIDYENDWNGLSDCLNTFIPLTELTAEELAYAMEYSVALCGYEGLVNKGLLEATESGYELTEKGRMRKKKLDDISRFDGV